MCSPAITRYNYESAYGNAKFESNQGLPKTWDRVGISINEIL